MAERRKSGIVINSTFLLTLISTIIISATGYFIHSIDNRVTRIEDNIARIEIKQDTHINLWLQCQKGISDLDKKFTQNLTSLKEQVLKWFSQQPQKKEPKS